MWRLLAFQLFQKATYKNPCFLTVSCHSKVLDHIAYGASCFLITKFRKSTEFMLLLNDKH